MSRKLDWAIVESCHHESESPGSYRMIYCGTPYCSGSEFYCQDCHAYITRCGCGGCNGIGGWSERRHRKQQKKKLDEIRNHQEPR